MRAAGDECAAPHTPGDLFAKLKLVIVSQRVFR